MSTYKVTAPYKPQNEDEILLKVSDLVTVIHKYDDGWCMAKNQTSLETGLAPLNFLVPYMDINPPSATPSAAQLSSASSSQSNIAFSAPVKPKSTSPQPKPTETQMYLINEKLKRVLNEKMKRCPAPNDMGFLKVMVVGDSGIGKSDFIDKLSNLDFIGRSKEPRIVESSGITEVIASTITEIPESLVSMSATDPELEYNLKLVDTPGFGAHVDATLTIDPIIAFLRKQFQTTHKFFTTSFGNKTMLFNLINSGGAHSHVDVCIYGILHRLKPIDKEFLKVLSPFVPIIPVIVKSDTLDKSQIFKLKESILRELESAGIQVYSFGMKPSECMSMAQMEVEGAIPFALSNLDTSFMSNRINEFEDFYQKLLFSFVGDIRRCGSLKFCEWREPLVQPESIAPPSPSPQPVRKAVEIGGVTNITENLPSQYRRPSASIVNATSPEPQPTTQKSILKQQGYSKVSPEKERGVTIDTNRNAVRSKTPDSGNDGGNRVSYFGGGRPQIGARMSSRPDVYKRSLDRMDNSPVSGGYPSATSPTPPLSAERSYSNDDSLPLPHNGKFTFGKLKKTFKDITGT